MTLVRIDKKDRDAVAYILTDAEIEHRFRESEEYPLMLEVLIFCDEPYKFWHLGRMVQIEVDSRERLAELKAEIEERERRLITQNTH